MKKSIFQKMLVGVGLAIFICSTVSGQYLIPDNIRVLKPSPVSMLLEDSQGNGSGMRVLFNNTGGAKIGFTDKESNWLSYSNYSDKTFNTIGNINVLPSSNNASTNSVNLSVGNGGTLKLLYKQDSEGNKIGFSNGDNTYVAYANNTTGKFVIGNESASNTGVKLHVNGGANFNNDADVNHLTQVTINTDTRVTGAALTVGGPTYIGTWQNAENMVNATHLSKYFLWVEKGIVTEDIAYAPKSSWSDYVFDKKYKLNKLEDLETFIQKNKHLPGVKTAEQVEKEGYSNHEFNTTILAKVEELTLYIIQQNKRISELETELKKARRSK